MSNQDPQYQSGPPSYPPAPQGSYGAYPQGGGYPQPRPGNGLAIASLVCGIVGLLILWIVLSPLAIIFGAIGLSRANRGASGHGQAMAGLILGIIGIVGYIVLIAIVANKGFVV